MKFSAVYGERARTKARDFHDIIFLARNYASLFSIEQIDSFMSLSKDIDRMLSFEDDYNEDSILVGQFENDVDELEEEAQKLKHLKDQKEIKSILEKDSESQTKKTKKSTPPQRFKP